MRPIFKYFLIIICIILFFYFATNVKSFLIDILNSINKNDESELVIKLEQLENENAYLRNALEMYNDYKLFTDAGVLEPIVARSIIQNNFLGKINFAYSQVIINAGFNQGVRENALVFVRGLLPIGTIGEVYDNSSQVILFTTSGKITSAIIDLPESTSTVKVSIDLIGDGGYNFFARAPDTMEVLSGQKLYLKNYPQLSIGEIVDIRDISSEAEKILYIKSNYNQNSPNFFYVER
jgi:hypothetical protein